MLGRQSPCLRSSIPGSGLPQASRGAGSRGLGVLLLSEIRGGKERGVLFSSTILSGFLPLLPLVCFSAAPYKLGLATCLAAASEQKRTERQQRLRERS